MNARLICRLSLIIAEQCSIRGGDESRAWREGNIVVFDESAEHEAWNLNKELRILLGAMLEATDQSDRLLQPLQANALAG